MASGSTIFSFAKIAAYFVEEEGVLQRGENGFRSKHIASCTYDGALKVLRGNVNASMRKDVVYHVEVYLSSNMDVQKSSCDCKRGQGKCHHMASLLFWAYHNISSTDSLCRWVAPKGAAQEENKDVGQLFPPGPSNINVDPASEEQLSQFFNDLRIAGVGAGLLWKVSLPPAEEDIIPVPAVEDVLVSKEYECAPDKLKFLKEALRPKKEVCNKVEEKTRGQSRNPLWLTMRKNRLTASNFGIILQNLEKKNIPRSFWSRIFGLYKLDGIKAIQWGKDHEKDAVNCFTRLTGLNVRSNGLFLDGEGILAASPDGLIGDDEILEVKCPFSLRDELSLKEAQRKESSRSFFYFNQDGDVVVNCDHDYYHQIQGQLYLTGRARCHFLQWNPLDCVYFKVEKDEDWEKNIELMKSFYFEKFIPKLINRIESEKQSDLSDVSTSSTSSI